MDTFTLERISKSEMSQIKGGQNGGYWICIDGQWCWIETYDLGEDEE